MSGAFFSQSWHRVAGLRPRILRHVRADRRRYGGTAWYALHDPLAGRSHRVSPAAYLFVARMDGRRTVDEIWQSIAVEADAASGRDAPGQDAVIRLLMQLHAADLLAGDVPPDAAALLCRRARTSRSVWARNLASPLSMQIPLVDPDAFLTRLLPLAAPLMTRAGAVAWLLLAAAGGLAAARHADELRADLAGGLLAGEGLSTLAVVYCAMKALHELAHGLAAKRLGCEVREMGVMLLALLPSPYVDASASAALPGKWSRAAVAAAGVATELGLAAAAALAWEAAEPGLLRTAAFDAMAVGASALLVNGNPLLRFDGYHVLADVLETPNLAQRSGRYVGHLAHRYAFGLPGMRDFSASARERRVMLLFAPASWCCRTLLLAGVSLFAASHYGPAGIAAAAAAVTGAVLRPAARALRHVAAGPVCRPRRARAAGLTVGGLAAAALLLLAAPAPLHSTAEGVIWLPEDAFLRAGADGFVRLAPVEPGATVAAGDTLMTLTHPIAEARLRVAAARVAELEARQAAEWVDDRAAAGVTGFELAQRRAELAREADRVARLTVTARASGVFGPVRPAADLLGRFVKEGEVLGWVTPASGLVARIVVPQSDIGLVRDRLARVTVRLADRRSEFASALVRAVPAARDELPSPALSAANGGAASPADPHDRSATRTSERMFQFDAALPATADVAAAGFGSRVYVRLDYAWEPLGRTIWRRVRQALLSRLEA
jgi:putative peptide zinc metalloprotease protein